MPTTNDNGHRFPALKDKQRAIRDGFPGDLGLRLHRALSWLQRAEMSGEDYDAAFIFYWIAFNAAYADELRDTDLDGERSVFDGYFARLTGLHRDWEAAFESSKRRVGHALTQKGTRTILSIVFDRLYVLRNQLVHGGATWNSRVNSEQVRDGAPYYPVVE